MEEIEIDLFDHPELIPQSVQDVLEKYGSDLSYIDLENMLKEVEALGYTFEYYLDATPYNLQKISK
jgi:hypothetical protein